MITMIFRQVNNLFLCDVTKDVVQHPHAFSISVVINKSKSADRDVKKAEDARVLMKRLGFPANSPLVKLLQSGSVLNAPCNSSDVYRAERIDGTHHVHQDPQIERQQIDLLKGKNIIPSIIYWTQMAASII
jgi:hypothetical protein